MVDRQTDKFIFILQLQALKKTLKRKKNSRFNVNMQLKLIYLQYEEAVKRSEVFESNDYLLFKQLVGGTELEDSQKQRFHISRSFSSDTCQGNRQNKECRAETAYKSAREKREVVSDWTKSVDQSKTEALVRDFQRVDKLLLPAQDWSRNFDVSGF